jgi:hypothetical protein
MAIESKEGKQPNRLDKYNGRLLKVFFTTNHQEMLYTTLEARCAPTRSAWSSYPLEEYIKLKL